LLVAVLAGLGGCGSDGQLGSLGATSERAAGPALDPNQQRLDAWTGKSFAHVVTAWGEPVDTRTFDDGRMLVRFQLHEVTEGDDKGALLVENVSGSQSWAELFDTTGETFERTCTVGFLFSPSQHVESAAIQEDDALFGSHCSGYIKDPAPNM
jgi:hypothetical protein